MAEYALGNIFARYCEEPLQAGQAVEGHKHNFDHVTFINHGRARIERLIPTEFQEDGEPKAFAVEEAVEKAAYEIENCVLIKKGVYHRITALEDHTTYVCVYSHRRADTGEVVEEYTGWAKAYN